MQRLSHLKFSCVFRALPTCRKAPALIPSRCRQEFPGAGGVTAAGASTPRRVIKEGHPIVCISRIGAFSRAWKRECIDAARSSLASS